MSINNLGSLLQSLPNNTLASLLSNSSTSSTPNSTSTDSTATDSTSDAKTQALLSMENFLSNDPLLKDASSAGNTDTDPLISLAEQAALMPTYNALGMVMPSSSGVPGSVNTSG